MSPAPLSDEFAYVALQWFCYWEDSLFTQDVNTDLFAWKERENPPVTGSVLILSPVASIVKLCVIWHTSPVPYPQPILHSFSCIFVLARMHRPQTPWSCLVTQAAPQTSLVHFVTCTHASVLLVLGSSFCVFQCSDFFQFTELLLPFRPLSLAEPIGPCRSTAAISTILPNNLFIQQERKGH